jgi:ketosteroid isomerase-like protein
MPDAAAESAESAETLRRAGEIYAEYMRGNRAFALDALADDVTWISVAGADLPWGGTWRGRAGVEAYFASLDRLVAITGYEVERMIAQGDWVVVLARGTGRFHPTGEVITLSKADVLRLQDGRIVEFREYYDSAALMGCIARCGEPPA